MSRAKLVLALLSIILIVGSVMAFKARRYNSTIVYTTASGAFTTMLVTTVKNGVSYSTVVPFCSITNAYFSTVGVLVDAFSWSVTTTVAFSPGGGTTTVSYETCPPTFSRTTSIAD